jgi:hypothetical protein
MTLGAVDTRVRLSVKRVCLQPRMADLSYLSDGQSF